MVAFAIPNVPRRLFPPDGRWHATDFWRDSIAVTFDPTTAEEATAGLSTVFDPEWAAATPDEPHAPHPFEYGYGFGEGVARLVRLGHCLHVLGDLPTQMRARLLNPAEFDVAEAEVRAAALFARLGASITWMSDPDRDFQADWSGHRVPVVVEQLDDPDGELGANDVTLNLAKTMGLPGVAILERRWPSTWRTSVVERVAQALDEGRYPSLGAVIMRQADQNPEASRTAEVLHVLPTPRWPDLPTEFRDRLPPGSHHVDLLPERAHGQTRSRLDDQDSARASAPAVRLAEALQLMRLGHRMRWSRLEREHPNASIESLHEMMLEWGRGDA